MKKHKAVKVPVYYIIIAVIAIVCALVFLFIDWRISAAITAVVIFVTLAITLYKKRLEREFFKVIKWANETLQLDGETTLADFPLPLLVCNDEGTIGWFNEVFRTNVLADNADINNNVSSVLMGKSINEIKALGSLLIEYEGKYYNVYLLKDVKDESDRNILLFVDITEQKMLELESEMSAPCVMFIEIDNFDEVYKDFKDSDKNAIMGGIDKIVENWMSKFPVLMNKLEDDSFIVVAQERYIMEMIENKFSILDKVRAYTYSDKKGVTLSIGVGRGGDLNEVKFLAKQGLDMALSRGGDQVAVNTNGQFEFYGGVSMGFERNTKAKTRIVATAIAELIEGCSNVLVMGHSFSDLDAIGSAVGIWSAARIFDKEANIVVSREQTLAGALIDRLENENMSDVFIEPSEALEKLDRGTLLFVVDTHRPDFVESPELYKKAKLVVVIDHHRKSVDCIDDAVIFYHEPIASSASEMVTELLQYMTKRQIIQKPEAEALMSGIMLDTRNFTIRVGVRTFEAAAYLRDRGADTVSVKQLFSNSLENYQIRSAVISNADTYKDCAITTAFASSADIRIISSQAADELLNIRNIKASFVLYRNGNNVNISARSLGKINVQLIMEKLGGGGHQTMAAAQLKNIS
ncbi:MAG: DHH family phosphoesterase, partial [Clostridiales bacterium]|nr:DHH family phosphoesterase [Clostridiales bacterium]